MTRGERMGQDYPQIREAGEALLAVCDGAREDDGQGYNGFDAPFARDVLGKGSWSPRQAAAMHKLLRKYKNQLRGHGIDYDEIPKPDTQPPQTVQTQVGGGQVQQMAPPQLQREAPTNIVHNVHEQYGLQFHVSFPFDAVVKDRFRAACKTTIWNPDEKTWIVPGKHAKELLAFAKEAGWKWNDDALFEAMKREREVRDKKRAEEEAAKASTAADSDFMADFESRSGYKLFPFQRAGVEYLVKKERAWLSDEMGIGKTVQALAVLHAVKGTPALIICPASAVSVWRRHVEEWLPGTTYTVAPEAPRAGSRHIHITSYDRCTRSYDKLIDLPWKAVICDEAHALKNREAKRTKRICGHYDRRSGETIPGLLEQARYRLLLSGTPVPNRPVEMIQPLMGLDRLKDVGGFVGFATRYCGWEKGVPGSIQGSVEENLPELNHKLRASCWVRRLQREVRKDLPDKMTDHIPLELADPKRYEATKHATFEDLFAKAEGDFNTAEALVKLTKLRRVAAEEKLPAATSWLENALESGEKLLLFGWHNKPLEQIKKHFGDQAVILTGSTSDKEREKAVDRFQNDDSVRLFVGNLQAAGEAITLTAASRVAIFELPWRPGQLDQAVARALRIGQTADKVMVHYLLAEGTIDEHIANLLDEKRKTIKAIEDGKEVKQEDMVGALLDKLREDQ